MQNQLLTVSTCSSLMYDTGPHLQIKAWAVVETGLATQYWTGKSEGFALHSQHARGLQHAPRKIIHSKIESKGISRIYIGVILALAVHIIIIL